MSKRKVYAIAAVAGLGVLVSYLLYGGSGRRPDIHFETARADRGRIVAKVTASGTLSALVTVQVGSQVSGRVAETLVDFNSPVKRGQVVAKIDPQLFDAALEQAKANHVAAVGNLSKARAQAADARRQYTRAKELAASQLIPQSDLDTAQANADAAGAAVEAAQGNVEQARAALHQAEVNLAYTTITSPTDGVVISRNVDVGQTVAASLQAPTLFVIAEDLRKMQVDTSVAEADIGKLEAGKMASFTVDAYASEVFNGKIRQIRNAPQTIQNVVTYDAVIDVDNPMLKLKPGMTANVTFVYAQRDDVLRVTNAALRFRPTPELLAQLGIGGERRGRRGSGTIEAAAPSPSPRGGVGSDPSPDRRTVWVLRDGVPSLIPIKVGVTDGTITEVVTGDIREGDTLITDASDGPGTAPPAGGPGFRRLL